MNIGFLTQIPNLFSNFYCLDEEFLDFFQVYRIFRKIMQKCQKFFKLPVKIQGFLEKLMQKYHKFKISGTKLPNIYKKPITYKTYRIF